MLESNPQSSQNPVTKSEKIGEFLNVTSFSELYNLLNKTDPGRTIGHQIMEVIIKAKELAPRDRFIRYIKFMATLHDPALRNVLNKLLITNDPALSKIQDTAYTKFLEDEKTQTEPVKSVVEGESDKTIEKLREAIERNNAIIARATKELEEIEERIAGKKAQTTEPKGSKNKEKITN